MNEQKADLDLRSSPTKENANGNQHGGTSTETEATPVEKELSLSGEMVRQLVVACTKDSEVTSPEFGGMAVPARRRVLAPLCAGPWGRLVCTGTKDSTNDRVVDFCETVIKIGRKDTCQVQYKGNMTISSVHCKISVEYHPEKGVQVRIEDTSSNGTYVNKHLLGKHKSCLLSQNDEVRLLTVDFTNEHFGGFVYTFQARARSHVARLYCYA